MTIALSCSHDQEEITRLEEKGATLPCLEVRWSARDADGAGAGTSRPGRRAPRTVQRVGRVGASKHTFVIVKPLFYS